MADEATETPEVVEKPKARAKPKSRAQVAREKAASEAKARESATLESSPFWQVIYPTGIHVHRPDVDEITVDVNGRETFVEVIDGFAVVPMNGKLQAESLDELEKFGESASQGMLRRVVDPA